jgi:mono/diheme cytochrome c family protein
MAMVAMTVLLAACGGGDGGGNGGGNEPVSGRDPELLAEGKSLYEGTCAVCHGVDLMGTQTGPPFLDPVYAPGHHPDSAFYTAVEFGVQPHHWDFGPMPPQPLEREEVTAVIAYVRSEQEKANIQPPEDHETSHG